MFEGNSYLKPHKQELVRSFSVQYTALILIILTFVVGAFVRPQTPSTGDPSGADPVVEQATPMGQMSFTNLFEDPGDTLNTDKTEALTAFLLSHDINLEMEVFGANPGSASTSEDVLARAVARSVTLFKHLVSKGVPPAALRIMASSERSDQQAQLVALRAEL